MIQRHRAGAEIIAYGKVTHCPSRPAPMSPSTDTRHRILYMAGLILAGEAIYTLPFHVARFFRPTVLEVFGLTNTELGTAQAAYGVIAMLAYFPGGALADRFSARRLMALSLWSTAAGGLYMATLPGYKGSVLLWGFFGISTILFFWAALIRATREWGGADQQGRAYGLLDGGRGLLAAALASLATLAFGLLFPESDATGIEEKKHALVLIIYGYALVTFAAGVFIWFALPDHQPGAHDPQPQRQAGSEAVWNHIIHVLRLPAVWLISVVVVCAYVGYKGFDNYTLYAVQVYGMNEVEAARLVATGAWMRPVAALGIGMLGDRLGVSRMTVACFFGLLVSQLVFAVYTPHPDVVWVLWFNILVGSATMFGLRALYFALLEEVNVPAALTGTAVGLISVIGYTPDIFVYYLGGILLDRNPGITGHQHFFYLLAAFTVVGLLSSFALLRRPGTASRTDEGSA